MSVRLINNTQGVSQVGRLVKVDSRRPHSFIYATPNSESVLGVVTEAMPYRLPCTVATGGVTKVFVIGKVRKGDIIRAQKSTDNIPIGCCMVAQDTDAPFLKVGTATESGRGLVSVSLEWAYAHSSGTETEYLRVDQTVNPQDTFGLFTFPSVWVTEEQLPISGDGMWLGLSSGIAPVFVAGVVEDETPNIVTLTYNMTLDPTSIPAIVDLTPSDTDASDVAVIDKDVSITVIDAYEINDVITMGYTAGVNPIRAEVPFLPAANLIAQAITNNITNLIKRANGFDWPDDNADGIGNGWAKFSGAGVGTIITGNGFTGNAQQITHINGTITRFMYSSITAEVGTTYRITGKYRAGTDGWRIYLRLSSDLFTINMGVNAGDAVAFTYTTIATIAEEIRICFYRAAALADDYLEIDEIILDIP